MVKRWGCGGSASSVIVVIILILVLVFSVILSHPVESGLASYLQNKLIVRLNHQLQGCVLLLQLLDGFFMLLTKRLQLCDPLARFCSLVTELTDILHCLVELLVKGTSRLHLVWQTSHAIMTSGRYHNSINSFMDSTQEMFGTGNDTFDHPPHGIAQPRLDAQHHRFHLQMSTSG
jgi:hypothetical protein